MRDLFRRGRRLSLVSLLFLATVLAGAASALLGVCGPFADVSDAAFCPFVLEIFTLGITTGTTPTTYDPASSVSRLQMAAFLSRTVDGTLKRGSSRAALDQFWTPQNAGVLGLTTVGAGPHLVVADGADLWVANTDGNSVSRLRASDGKLLETWTGAEQAFGVLAAMGRIFVTRSNLPGTLYRIDPSQAAGVVTTITTDLGDQPQQMAFDGSRIWTGNNGGSVSIVTPGATLPWTVATVTSGFIAPRGILYDGTNAWVLDGGKDALLKLDPAGAILQTVSVGDQPFFPVFDGSNIWAAASLSNTVTVVRASTGAVLATLTANGLSFPVAGAFDGQRVLIVNGGNSVSLWKAADLTPLGSFSTGSSTLPWGACSDGRNFWIAFNGTNQLARF